MFSLFTIAIFQAFSLTTIFNEFTPVNTYDISHDVALTGSGGWGSGDVALTGSGGWGSGDVALTGSGGWGSGDVAVSGNSGWGSSDIC